MNISGGLAALACYTVDSDSDSDQDEEEKKVDFGDLYIKEEPAWSLDTDGHKDPQDLIVPEFSVVQVEILRQVKRFRSDNDLQVKQEIVSDSESSDSDSSEEEEIVQEKEKEEEVEKELPPKTKNELGLSDLPAVEDLSLKVRVPCPPHQVLYLGSGEKERVSGDWARLEFGGPALGD